MTFLVLVFALGFPRPGSSAELIGLRNITLEPEERVWGFHIELEEGRIVAVCYIPEGWKITAENYGEAASYKDGGGEVEGGADFGHDALPATELHRLGALLLIDRSTVHHKPAKLSGFLTTSGPSDNRKVSLRASNFSRREAERCPKPPAVEGWTGRPGKSSAKAPR